MGQNESSRNGSRRQTSRQSNQTNSNSQIVAPRDENAFESRPQGHNLGEAQVPDMLSNNEGSFNDQNLSNLPLPPISKLSNKSNHANSLPLFSVTSRTVEFGSDVASASNSNISSANIELPDSVTSDVQATESKKSNDPYSRDSAPVVTHPFVKRDVRTVPKRTSESANDFLSAKFTADLEQYRNKTETKNLPKDVKVWTRNRKHKSNNIRAKLEEIYSLNNLSPNCLDQIALQSLNNLSENDALDVLRIFSRCDLKTIHNKSAYLCSIIKSRTNEENVRKLTNKTPPPYFDSTPLMPFSSETISSVPNCTDDGNVQDNKIPKKHEVGKINILPETSSSNMSLPLNEVSTNALSNQPEQAGIKELPLLNFIHFNPVDDGKDFERSGKPLPAATFHGNPKSNLSKIVGNHSMKSNNHSSKSVVNKHAELQKIADKLTKDLGKDPTPHKKNSPGINLKHFQLSDNNETNSQTTFEECVFQLEKLDVSDQNKINSLQPAIFHNFKITGIFLNLLKEKIPMNENIQNEIKKLKEIILMIADGTYMNQQATPSFSETVTCSYLLDTVSNVEESKSDFIDNKQLKVDSDILISEKRISDAQIVRNKDNDMSKQNISLNTFISLMKNLSPEFENQTQDIALKDDTLFCNVCERPVAFTRQNLEEHLLGKNHKQKINEITGNLTPIGKNHLGILDIVYDSCKRKLSVPFQLYICIHCDLPANNEIEATSHVDHEDHAEINKKGDTKWHYCEVCPINIFGTSNDFKQHCLTRQHLEIMKLRGVGEPDEEDRHSICSSKSNISNKGSQLKNPQSKTPHEILLDIAKEKILEMNGQTVGLYCQVCRRYFLNPSNLISHLKSGTHNEKLSVFKGQRKALKNYYCATCNVEIYGLPTVMKEHNSIDMHVTMIKEKNECSNKNILEQNELCPDDLSDRDGPHFEMMTIVIKRHLLSESSDNTFFGFYCHPCRAYSVNERQWAFHQGTASHIHRLNSSEYVGKIMFHDCVICNVRMICDDDVFKMHNNCMAHALVKRRKDSTGSEENPDAESESLNEDEDEESTDGSDEDSEDFDEDATTDGNDSQVSNQNSTKQNQTSKPERPVVPNGVYIIGLPANTSQKEVFDDFRSFGFIKKISYDENKKSCMIIFRKNDDAERLVNIKTLIVRDSRITIRPLLGITRNKKRGRGASKDSELSPKVVSVLSSRRDLQNCVELLQKEVVTQGLFFTRKSDEIRHDITSIFKYCKVHFFGSQVTGLALENSDFDIYIDFDNRSFFKTLPQKDQQYFLHMLLAEFTKPNSKFKVTESVPTARVPIIRTVHLGTNTPCDISCCSGLSVENSQLVKLFVSSDIRVRWLVLFVKWWMQANGLLDRSIFTSYATTWLVFFFLMQLPKPVLCSVAHLRQGCPNAYSIASWDCRFTRNMNKIFKMCNKQSSYELLAHFFAFYGSFPFKAKVLCPLTATLISREDFLQLRIPPEYSPYINKVRQQQDAEKLKVHTPICLQDPFDLSHNITKGVCKTDLQRFQALCVQSAKLCKKLIED